MRSTNIRDLEELTLMCRDGDSKDMLEEAVHCYRAGALRACIVSTWLAVAYDIMGKIRELASAGDPQASQQVVEMDDIIEKHDTKRALEFENKILDIAKEHYELISQNELADLQRLYADRHRCAHPSLNRAGEVYRPTAETARAHLRLAVEHLLSQAPTQGKAALDRVLADIESPLFPEDTKQAVKALSLGPMARPKDSLLRNVVNALVSSLLQEDVSWRQKFAALGALRQMHRLKVEPSLGPRIIDKATNVADAALWRVIRFVKYVEDGWQHCPEAVRVKLPRYLSTTSINTIAASLIASLEVAELKETALARIRTLNRDELKRLIATGHPRVVIERAIDLYGLSEDFDEANTLKQILLEPLKLKLKPEDAIEIAKKAALNPQILESFGFRDLLGELRSMESFDIKSVDEAMLRIPQVAHFVPKDVVD